MDIIDVLTHTGFIIGFTFLLSMPLVCRLVELVRWNNGICKPLNKKWKHHSVYKNGDILYIANPDRHLIVTYPELINKSKDSRLKHSVFIIFSLILLAFACLVAVTLGETLTNTIKLYTYGLLAVLPSFYMAKQLLYKLKGYINEHDKGSKKQ